MGFSSSYTAPFIQIMLLLDSTFILHALDISFAFKAFSF